MGRCMYSGEKIPLKDLYDKNIYDIDHIYPRSKVKDDSLDNRVLVKRQLNKDKGCLLYTSSSFMKKISKKIFDSYSRHILFRV